MTIRSSWYTRRIVTIENKGAAAYRTGLLENANPYTTGYSNQNGKGGQVQRQRAQAWTRGWRAAEQRSLNGEVEDLPNRFKVLKPASKFTLIQRFYRTAEPINPWRCECCITQQQRREILEEVPQQRVLKELGTNICCRKCGLDFMT